MKVITTLTPEEKEVVNDLFENEAAANKGAFSLSKTAKSFAEAAWKTIKETHPEVDTDKGHFNYDRKTGEVSLLFEKTKL